jgi:TPR repeat protein
MQIFTLPRRPQIQRNVLLALILMLCLQESDAIPVPSGAANAVARGSAQFLAKFGFNALRRRLNIIYKRDKWKDAFDFIDFYQTYLDNEKVPPELQQLGPTAIAANKGDPIAQRKLGLAYLNGDKVRRDFKKSSYWFTKAVEEKDGLSMVFLGRMFNRGMGVPRNTVGAYCLFNLAAANGEARLAQREIQAVKRRLSPTQLREAQSCMD